MKDLSKFLFCLTSLLVFASCASEDEPTGPELKGEVETGFFTNLITSNETCYFSFTQVERYKKYDNESDWKADDTYYFGGSIEPELLFHKGSLYFQVDWMVFYESFSSFDILLGLYNELRNTGRKYPDFFVASPLNYDEAKRELTFRYCCHNMTYNVISTDGNRFRAAKESSFTTSAEKGFFLQIIDYVEESHHFSVYELNEAMYFKSWKELANFLVDEAEEHLDFKPDFITLEEIREFYSSKHYDYK